jgi:hypothetical protein
MGALPGGRVPLLALDRSGSAGDARRGRRVAGHIGHVAADRRVQRVGVQVAKDRRKVFSLGTTRRPVNGSR